MNAMSLFVSGIVAGIALVYFIVHYLSFTTEPLGREMNDSVEVDTTFSEGKQEMQTVSIEEMDAWYNSVMEIFAVKE